MSALPSASHVTAILTAMPEEAEVLRTQLRDPRRLAGSLRSARWAITGQLGTTHVVLAITGDGERSARERAEQVFAAVAAQACTVDRMLVLGVAGALSPELREGALIVADAVQDELSRERLVGDRGWAELAVRHTGAVRGLVLSAADIADTLARKRELLQLTLGSAGQSDGNQPAAVDLESYAYARLAQAHGIPWLVVRAISDTADEALPGLLNRCRDDGGRVKRSRVARALLMDPRPLPQLLRLSRRVSRASILLARAAGLILSCAPPRAAAESDLGRT